MNYNTPLTIITWAGKRFTVILPHWKSRDSFSDLAQSDKYAVWRQEVVCGPGITARCSSVFLKGYGPGEWHHRRLAEERVVGRSPFTAWWAWQSQIPKFTSQNSNGDALKHAPSPAPTPSNTTPPTHGCALIRLDFLSIHKGNRESQLLPKKYL